MESAGGKRFGKGCYKNVVQNYKKFGVFMFMAVMKVNKKKIFTWVLMGYIYFTYGSSGFRYYIGLWLVYNR